MVISCKHDAARLPLYCNRLRRSFHRGKIAHTTGSGIVDSGSCISKTTTDIVSRNEGNVIVYDLNENVIHLRLVNYHLNIESILIGLMPVVRIVLDTVSPPRLRSNSIFYTSLTKI